MFASHGCLRTCILSRGIRRRGLLFASLGLALFFATLIGGLRPEGLQDHRPEAGIDLSQIGHQLVLGHRIEGPDLLKFAHHLLQGLGIRLAAGRFGRRRRGCFRIAGGRLRVGTTARAPRPWRGCAAGQKHEAASHGDQRPANSGPVLEAAIAHAAHRPNREYPYNRGQIVMKRS